jgi:hypothetical protein
MAKDRENISPRMRAHLQSLVDRHGSEEGSERPSPPRRPTKLRKPMSGPIRGGVYVDGQFVGDTPTEWAEPQHSKSILVAPAPAEETEDERRCRVKRQKEAERELMEMRSEARARARAAATPPRKPLSPAVRNHLLGLLVRPDAELLEG